MASLEAPTLRKQDGSFRVLELNVKLVYWQGLWYEDPEANFEFYLRFYSPWLAHLLVKYRFLRLTQRYFYKILNQFNMTYFTVLLTLIFPRGIVMFWDDKEDVVKNCYFYIATATILAGYTTMLLQKEAIKLVFDKMNQIARVCLENKDEAKILNDTDSYCTNLTKYLHMVVVPVFTGAAVSLHIFHLLPNRKLMLREWYPFDTSQTPYYEIVFYIRGIQLILHNLTAVTLITFVTGIFLYMRTFFKIVIKKIEMIVPRSMNLVREMRLKASERRGADNLAKRNGDHEVPVVLKGLRVESTRNKRKIGHRQPANQQLIRHKRVNYKRVLINAGRVEQLHHLARLPGSHPGRRVDPVGAEDLVNRARRSRDVTAEELDKEMTRQLSAVVELHAKVLRVARDLAKIINYYLGVMFLVNTVTLAVTALFFTTVDSFGSHQVMYLLLSLEITLLYLMQNYMANDITTESQAVGEAIYFTDWISASPSFKKNMLIIMSRTNVPVEVKPTGLDPLSLKLFSEVSIKAYKMINTLNTFV